MCWVTLSEGEVHPPYTKPYPTRLIVEVTVYIRDHKVTKIVVIFVKFFGVRETEIEREKLFRTQKISKDFRIVS